MFSLPNVITVARLALIPFIVRAIVAQDCMAALAMIAIAGASDALDGFLARRFQWQTRTGAKHSPRISNDEPLKLECRHFLELVERGPGDHAEARAGLAVVRTLELLQSSLAGVPA